MKICICDDDNNIHGIIKSYINKFTNNDWQFDIFDAFSAEELINQYLQQNTFDIIF